MKEIRDTVAFRKYCRILAMYYEYSFRLMWLLMITVILQTAVCSCGASSRTEGFCTSRQRSPNCSEFPSPGVNSLFFWQFECHRKRILVAAGERHCIAISISGSVWSWGQNDHGQLGTGDIRRKTFEI